MRITQLDYSAIRAANSATANANSIALAVEQSQHNALATQFNVDSTKNYIDAVNRENYAKGWINASMRLANTGLQILEWGLKYKDQADGETAVNALTDAAGSLSDTYDQQYQNDVASFFDGDNNIVKPQAIIDQEDALRNNIQNLSISDSKKQEALADLEDMFNKAWDGVGEQLAGREIQARNEAWTTRLNEALEVDSALGTPDNGLEMIQNTGWLTPTEKESASAQYTNNFNAKTHANQASMLARTKGQSSANEYIDNLVNSGEINEDEWLSLSALVNKVGGEQDANVAQNAVQYATEQMEIGVLPATINEQLKLELDNMDNERREYVQTELNKAYYQHALEVFNWPADMSTLSAPQLQELKTNVEERGAALLPDMPTELNAMKASIQKELDTRTTANAKGNIQSMDILNAAVDAGYLAPSAAIAQIRESAIYGDSDTSDDEAVSEYIKEYGNKSQFVPQQYKSLYTDLVTLYEDSVKNVLGIDMDDPEQRKLYIDYADQGRAYILDYFYNTPAEKITAADIKEAFNRANEIFLGGTIQDLEAIRSDNEGRTLIQQGFSDLDTGYLEDVTNLLMEMPEGMISLNPNGQYESPSTLVTNYWGELEIAERNLVQQLNLGDPKNWTVTPYKRTNADGSTTEVPIPVLQSPDGTRYTIVGNEFLKQEKDNDQWDVITTINKSALLPADDTITPPTAEQIREGQESVDVSNPPSLDSYKDPWVMPSPEDVAQGQRAVVIDDSGEPFSHLADEGGDVRVRRVQGEGTQFWHNGIWYRVNDLPENSPILKAYDEYMKTFEGSIPKVTK